MSELIPVLRYFGIPNFVQKNYESLDSVSFGDKLFDSKVSEYFPADFAILIRCKTHIMFKHVNSARATNPLGITA